ncbi:hypothetical protein SAMN05660443_1559 [Marinospirillum celere]|uniref:Molecular chaperone n=1 Tax=Marinospirillum celere TaxID=1122252 RepID=A0A1I1GPE6_9GAMM|nr:hypothetical protein [Marinospirillum celere]SFC13514.1 hypothetical protein SAMN05660443_1559 [Marinospirillum celere]
MRMLPLDFPELCRDHLETCELRREALEDWLLTLPLAHPLASQEKLAQLLSEFNELHFPPPRRLEWLNKIASTATRVCQDLDATNHLAKEGEAAQDLDSLLAQGYKRTLHDLLGQREHLPSQILGPSLLQALYKATTHISALIRRSCQFSVPAPEPAWRELYLLYRMACQSRLQKRKIQPQAPSNCEEAYYQALLLGMVQAEVLRSDEVELIYSWLAQWSELLEITAPTSEQALFQVLASQNFCPRRSQKLSKINQEQDFGINTQPLALEVQRLLEAATSPLSNRLLQHLLSQISNHSDRNAPRIEASGSVSLVLGLRSVHYHLSGRKAFEQLAAGGNLSIKKQTNPFLDTTPLDDPWAAAHDATENLSSGQVQLVDIDTSELSTSIDDELNKRFPVYHLQQVNTSATGYCLAWEGEAPRNLATGELVALKESSRDLWQPAVIRWVRQAPGGYQLGVEVLPSRMQPCALKPVIKVGDPVDYMPGFLIPELKILDTPASVITPLLPFKEGQKVDITGQQGKQRTRLVRLLSTPGEFNQFQLESPGPDSSLQAH